MPRWSKQAIPLALAGLLAWAAVPARACGPTAPVLERLSEAAADVWWVRAERGDAAAANRGRVSNLLIVREGARVWAVGSGPSRAFGRALDCAVRRDLGQPITDVISPWPRPELVLGAAALPRARHWAHADVARAMRTQCARCVTRLAARLGAAVADLEGASVRLPDRLVRGTRGRLGPFEWWRLERARGVALTLWRARGVLTAHGLLWSGDAPDLRDSRIEAMAAATEGLARLHGGDGVLLGEQGAPAQGEEIEAHQAYWRALAGAVRDAQARGGDATSVPDMLDGIARARTRGTAHALNWQRAWRQAEEQEWLGR